MYNISVDILRDFLLVLFALVGAPILGGLLTGFDRIITARMQNRVGPPLMQPFYDFLKLMGKETIVVNRTQGVFIFSHVIFAAASMLMLVFKQDLLMILFVLAFSTVSLIVGAMSVRSPYSKIGAQREIIQMMSYEPVLILMVVGIYMVTKSFMISEIFKLEGNLFYSLPLVFMAFIYVLTIKVRKSPFDFSTSHHGHQELIKGITTEFAGKQLAFIELTHWFDLALLLGMISLFFAQPLWFGIIVALACYFLEIVIDNICARLTWKWMVKASWIIGIGLAMTNIVWLYLKQV